MTKERAEEHKDEAPREQQQRRSHGLWRLGEMHCQSARTCPTRVDLQVDHRWVSPSSPCGELGPRDLAGMYMHRVSLLKYRG